LVSGEGAKKGFGVRSSKGEIRGHGQAQVRRERKGYGEERREGVRGAGGIR